MPKLIITKDGSTTFYVEEVNEHYHSTFGAVQESQHVFIEAGLNAVLKKQPQIKLLEVGFGTGLNALLSLRESINNKVQIQYWAVEPFPLIADQVDQLNFGGFLKDANLQEKLILMHQIEWGEKCSMDANFEMIKIKQKIEQLQLPDQYFDLVYFDAFSPDVQPELWTENIFKKLFDCMIPTGVLVTYSVKGIVKRALKSAGFIIEKLPGPKGKREILRAIKPGRAE